MIQLIRFMRDAEDFNTGGGTNPELAGDYKIHEPVDTERMKKQIEELTMQQTPIGFFKNKVEALMDAAYTVEEAISIALPESLRYEKQYLRDVAEKAVVDELESIIDKIKEVHAEYIGEIISERIDIIENGI